jgi:hypothetical protein
MSYWTVLWITVLSGPLDGADTGLIYPDYVSCVSAHKAITDTLPYDYTARCEQTETPSGSIRPRKRPW